MRDEHAGNLQQAQRTLNEIEAAHASLHAEREQLSQVRTLALASELRVYALGSLGTVAGLQIVEYHVVHVSGLLVCSSYTTCTKA